ncbi:hypothetical protein HGRIS_003687 [Hohenbuehelia grisea]|uniref:FHA domain-containing protein n=1 Tax=Hohenbuehelia grisea TaxID=104357 RepID=A0ABR3JG30_9AGAR
MPTIRAPLLRLVESVEFIRDGRSSPNGARPEVVKMLRSNGKYQDVTRWFDSKFMSRKHGELLFDPDNGKVYICDGGSASGTWLQTVGPLKKDSFHELKDGDVIIFGAQDDKGKISDSVRVTVKLHYARTLPRRRSTDDSLLKPPRPGHRPNNSDSHMKLPVPTSHANKSDSDLSRKKTSNDLPRKPPVPKPPTPGQNDERKEKKSTPKPPPAIKITSSKGSNKKTAVNKPPAKVTFQDPKKSTAPEKPTITGGSYLQREVWIPWSKGFQVGDGIDALTGESMDSALEDESASLLSSLGPQAAEETAETYILEWQRVHELRDEYEMEATASINVACPAGFGVRYTSTMQQNNSISNLIVQHCVKGRFDPELIARPKLKGSVRELPDHKFREKYGDYYIAGLEKGYSCRITVVCMVRDLTNIESAEIEAKAMVGDFFGLGGRRSESMQQSDKCSFLHATVDTWGYPTAEVHVPALSMDKAFETLQHIRSNPLGTPRLAILRHYSRLEHCALSPHVSTPRKAFDDVYRMRQIYSKLQVALVHPALQEYRAARRAIQSSMEEFSNKRLVILRDTTWNEKRRAEILSQLREAQSSADNLRWRYNFILNVRRSSRKIECRRQADGRYKWECGIMGIAEGRLTLNSKRTVTLPNMKKAFEVDWTSPPTKRSILGSFFAGEPQAMELLTEPAVSATVYAGPSGRSIPPRQPESFDSTFTRRLVDVKMYIVGWTLSCQWNEKKPPEIKVVSKDNGLLKSGLKIELDNSATTTWHCRVTYVLHDKYNFPDLHLGD